MTIRKGSIVLVFSITIFAALPPFAIDTYMPAFNQIGNYFHVTTSDLTKSISTYFLGFAIGMLAWGAITDRFGRRKPLIVGMGIYLLSSVLCSVSVSYNMLMAMRFVQGLGDSSGSIIAMAIIRDCYKGERLMKTMSMIAMTFMLAPIIAPIIGSIIIYETNDWKMIFHFLTLYGILLFIFSFFIPETLKNNKRSSSILANINVYIKHLGNIPFLVCAIITGFTFAAVFSFISSSSLLIINYLKLGYLQYCILFAINISTVILSNFYVKKRVNKNNHIKTIFTGFFIAILMLIINVTLSNLYNNIYIFMLFNALATGFFALTNVLMRSITLNSLDSGFGAGSAIANLIRFSFGGLSSYLMSHKALESLQVDISVQQLAFVSVSVILFTLIFRKIKNK